MTHEENEQTLLQKANQQFVSANNCNVCLHCQSVRERCGHIVERCHHPNLDAGADNEWPEVDGTMICDWYVAKYARSKP